jgi:hypothetical protein
MDAEQIVDDDSQMLQRDGNGTLGLFALADVLTHTAKHSLGSPRRVLLAFQIGLRLSLGPELLIMKESDIMGILTDLPAAKKKAV